MAIYNLKVIKKSGNLEDFNIDKIITAVSKAAEHTTNALTSDELSQILDSVYDKLEIYNDDNIYEIPVDEVHDIVVNTLFEVRDDVANRYVAYHEFTKTQNIVSDSLNSLFSSEDVNQLAIGERRHLLELNTAKDLAYRYKLRPDWQEAVNDKIITLPNIETLWYNTSETSSVDLVKILQDPIKYIDEFCYKPESILEAIELLKLYLIKESQNYTVQLDIENFGEGLAIYADKSYYQALADYSSEIVDTFGSSDNSHNLAKVLARKHVAKILKTAVLDLAKFIKTLPIKISFRSLSMSGSYWECELYSYIFDSDCRIYSYRYQSDLTIQLHLDKLWKLANDDVMVYKSLVRKYGYMVLDIFTLHHKSVGESNSGLYNGAIDLLGAIELSDTNYNLARDVIRDIINSYKVEKSYISII